MATAGGDVVRRQHLQALLEKGVAGKDLTYMSKALKFLKEWRNECEEGASENEHATGLFPIPAELNAAVGVNNRTFTIQNRTSTKRVAVCSATFVVANPMRPQPLVEITTEGDVEGHDDLPPPVVVHSSNVKKSDGQKGVKKPKDLWRNRVPQH